MSRSSEPMRSRSRESEVRGSGPRVSFDEEKIKRDKGGDGATGGGDTKKIPSKESPQTLHGKGNQKGGGKETTGEKGDNPRKGFWQRRKQQKKKNAVDLKERSPTPHPSRVRRVSLERK